MLETCQFVEATVSCDCKKCLDGKHERITFTVRGADVRRVVEQIESQGWHMCDGTAYDEDDTWYAPGHRREA